MSWTTDAVHGTHTRRLTRATRLLAAITCTLGSVSASAALVVNINPLSGLAGNQAAIDAFNRAGDRWEAIFTDTVQVNIDADLQPLPTGVLGQAGSSLFSTSYSTVRAFMAADALAEPDDGVVQALPLPGVGINYNAPAGTTINSGSALFTRANGKALGLISPTAAGADAAITFSSNFAFDFDPTDGITPGTFDFEAVAAHEIGHALGFVSIVDSIDTRATSGQTNFTPTVSDFFRFEDNTANDPANFAQFGTFTRSLEPGVIAIFDDVTNEVLMSTGVVNGDGRQASHWKDGLGLGLLDPTLAAGEIGIISANDIRALDLVGWDFQAVPEPALLTLVGVGALTLWRRWPLL